MQTTRIWQPTAALFMALGVSASASLPLVASLPAAARESYQVAQLFQNPSRQVGLPAGTEIPVRYDAAERVIVAPGETVELELTLAEDLRSSRGTVVLREGSIIRGELRPVDEDNEDEGTYFVASEVVPDGTDRAIPLVAYSDAITETQTIDRRTNPDILRGAAIGAAAAAVLSEIFGSIDFLEVLAGAGVGVLGEVLIRRNEEVDVYVIEPDTDLDLRLEEDFVLSRSSSGSSTSLR
ncbi:MULTISPECIES: hypothetical protein [unclassified Leptolyngbya]|uniref:hypothetical protein n=1 Tax=unclassified Leptolyngbya TaxID=2650499 RepID=UPI001686251B|nr:MULTISPECIES: hypothetical protein [unclassified Leptolyngbya]MBD1911034.1 hypothetical protein [Leptolyngbya sp. FACHB-8]MBD2158300.1 hypothetical protein [Leptolyngbya sp. FACHB-16]